MQADYLKVLEALGCPVDARETTKLRCPMHPGTGRTLRVENEPTRDTLQFKCIAPSCGFSGDIIALTAAARKISYNDAAEEFRRNGSLRHTVADPENADVWLGLCLEDKSRSLAIREYIRKCRVELISDEGAATRSLMGQAGAMKRPAMSLRSLPPEIGMYLPDNVPAPLKALNKPAYRKGNYVIFPYWDDNTLSRIRMRNFADISVREYVDIVLDPDRGGICMGSNIAPGAGMVTVVPDELEACRIYVKAAQISSKPSNVIAARKFPLPDTCRNIREIKILSTSENLLTLERAIEYLNSAEEAVSGRKNVRVYVNTVRMRTRDILPERLRPMLFSPHKDTNAHREVSLARWIARDMMEKLNSGGEQDIYNAMDMCPLSNYAANAIMHRATGNMADIKKIIQAYAQGTHGRYALSNGKTVRATPSGFKYNKLSGDSATLSNTILDVKSCILTENKELKYICTARSHDTEIPEVSVTLGPDNLSTGKRLTAAVKSAFAERGYNPYVSFYTSKSCTWADVLSRLSRNTPVTKEVEQLGADENLDIQLPEIIIRPSDKAVLPQRGAGMLPGKVLELYRGLKIDKNTSPERGALRQLIENTDNNSYVSAFTTGLLHIIYQIIADIQSRQFGTQCPPRHLFFAEPESDVWLPVFSQLSQLFTGQAMPPNLPSGYIPAHMKEIRKIGSMPYIALLPDCDPDRIARTVADAPVSLISIAGNSIAPVLSSNPQTSFVIPIDYSEERCQLNPDDVLAAQAELPRFIAEFVHAVTYGDIKVQTTMAPPPMVVYEAMAEYLGVNAELPDGLVQNNYIAAVPANALAFFHALYSLLYGDKAKASKLGIRINYAEPEEMDKNTRKDKPVLLAVGREKVVISRSIVDIVNMEYKRNIVFSSRGLDADMERNGFITAVPGFSRQRYWGLDRSLWDKYIMKIPLTLPETVSQGNVINLRRITAA